MGSSDPEIRRRKWRLMAVLSAAFVTTIAIVLVVRYVTFDPKRFISEVQDRLNPLQPRSAATLRTSASGTSAGPAISASDAAQRVRELELTMAALRQRHHKGAGPCFRYPTKEDASLAPEGADQVADAILAADLAGRLEALVPTSARWARDADDATHSLGADREVVDHFADEAGLWTKLGVALHRGAIQEAARAVFQPRLPPAPEPPLSPEEAARARPIWERFGHLQLLKGAMTLARRVHVVDLRGTQLRLVEPGMSDSAVRARLGPAEEDGALWRYPRLGTEVSFDEQRRVKGIASGLAFGDQVVVDGAEQRALDEVTLARVMGRPLRDAQGEGGETVLVYAAGAHAMLLVFTGQLARVELWRKDLVAPAAR